MWLKNPEMGHHAKVLTGEFPLLSGKLLVRLVQWVSGEHWWVPSCVVKPFIIERQRQIEPPKYYWPDGEEPSLHMKENGKGKESKVFVSGTDGEEPSLHIKENTKAK